MSYRNITNFTRFELKDWECNGRAYVAYRNYIRRPRNWESSHIPSQASTPGNRLVMFLSNVHEENDVTGSLVTLLELTVGFFPVFVVGMLCL